MTSCLKPARIIGRFGRVSTALSDLSRPGPDQYLGKIQADPTKQICNFEIIYGLYSTLVQLGKAPLTTTHVAHGNHLAHRHGATLPKD